MMPELVFVFVLQKKKETKTFQRKIPFRDVTAVEICMRWVAPCVINIDRNACKFVTISFTTVNCKCKFIY